MYVTIKNTRLAGGNMNYLSAGREELKKELEFLNKKYLEFKNKNLFLNMARGKPSKEQLDLSKDILTNINTNDFEFSGVDIRNYGLLKGLPEARKLMSDIMGCLPEETIVGGNSSLSLMHDVIANFFVKGSNINEPWSNQKVKFLCPCPGYDRHFQLCEFFGISMIPIKLNNDGPDINKIKELVEKDEYIKAIWCVPKYSNPEGVVYSDRVIKELANLKPKAPDFKILWDNAYSVHDLYDEIKIANIFDECKKAGNQNMPIGFCSTSKITFAAGGISAIGCLDKNFIEMSNYFAHKTVSFDKINQARHVKFLKNFENIKLHMKKHANILRPKFEFIIKKFEENFKNNKILEWTNPKGGYFISVYTYGSAKKVELLCKEAGLIITPAGAAYPYGIDPNDSNIRIAPSFPTLSEIEDAINLFCLCVKISSIEKILGNFN